MNERGPGGPAAEPPGADGLTERSEGARRARSAARPAGMADPLGRHALFSAPPAAAPDQLAPGEGKDGRHAFYSTGPRRPGTVVVSCSSCGVRTRVTLAGLLVRLLPFTAWNPARRHNQLLRCPACERRGWCGISWLG